MKYRNVKSAGYDSKKESRRAQELKLLERAGKISDLQEQVKFDLIPAQYIDGKCVERACTWKADFVYVENNKTVVEDCKGVKTQQYIVRRKLMLWVHGIRITEV